MSSTHLECDCGNVIVNGRSPCCMCCNSKSRVRRHTSDFSIELDDGAVQVKDMNNMSIASSGANSYVITCSECLSKIRLIKKNEIVLAQPFYRNVVCTTSDIKSGIPSAIKPYITVQKAVSNDLFDDSDFDIMFSNSGAIVVGSYQQCFVPSSLICSY